MIKLLFLFFIQNLYLFVEKFVILLCQKLFKFILFKFWGFSYQLRLIIIYNTLGSTIFILFTIICCLIGWKSTSLVIQIFSFLYCLLIVLNDGRKPRFQLLYGFENINNIKLIQDVSIAFLMQFCFPLLFLLSFLFIFAHLFLAAAELLNVMVVHIWKAIDFCSQFWWSGSLFDVFCFGGFLGLYEVHGSDEFTEKEFIIDISSH